LSIFVVEQFVAKYSQQMKGESIFSKRHLSEVHQMATAVSTVQNKAIHPLIHDCSFGQV
jgi:hypothetical protein